MPHGELHKVQKVGSSLGITLPRELCRVLKIQRGDVVSFAVYNENVLTVRVVRPDELQRMKPHAVM